MTDRTNTVLTIPEPHVARLVERPFPRLTPGYVVVEVEIAPICIESRIWTEHQFEWVDDPDHLGHEGVGTIAEVAAGSHWRVGERVIVFQGDYCGRCPACRNGLSPTYCDRNASPDGAALRGIEAHNDSDSGGFAMGRYRLAPEPHLYAIPDDMDFKYAAAANCSLGCTYTGQEEIGVHAGEFVLVTGIGFLGLSHVINALYRNATPIVLVRNSYRAELCRRLGVQHILDPEDPTWLDQVRAISGGRGVQCAAECSGAPFYQRKCIEACDIYGRVALAGFQGDPKFAADGAAAADGTVWELNVLNDILDKHLTLTGGHDVRATHRDGLVRMLHDPAVKRGVDVLVTHEFPMTQAAAALDVSASKQCGKIYLYPQK